MGMFEPEGSIEAFKAEFRLVKFLGCWFHFGQCMYRKLCEFGFKKEYTEDEELKEMFKKGVALAIMPIDKIDLVFEEMIICRSRNLLTKYPNFEKYLAYVIDTWVGDENTQSTYDRKIWNHWESDLETRTNNNNEAYNLRLQKKIGVDYPNIWVCVEELQKEEKLIAVNYVLVKDGNKKTRGF